MKNIVTAMVFTAIFILSVSTHSPAWTIPDTGQTQCYDDEGNELNPCPEPRTYFHGQDATYTINPRSYTKLDEDGYELSDLATDWAIVRDNVTGLMWELKSDDGSVHDRDNKYTWYDSNPETNGGDEGTPGDGTDTEDFIDTLNAEKFGGFSDWRLPTLKELSSIVNLGNINPAINKEYFAHSHSSYYYTSTSDAETPANVWCIYFGHAQDYIVSKSNAYYVRAVRGASESATGTFTDNGDGTVSDALTGLMWQKQLSDSTTNWKQAIVDCERLELADYYDWRLPNREELRSIADYERYNPAVNTDYFPDIPDTGYYLSSTTYAYKPENVWTVEFSKKGNVSVIDKPVGCYVRAVRNIQTEPAENLLILAPVTGTKWKARNPVTIKWRSQDIADNVKISLSRRGEEGVFETIAESTENDGEYEWLVAGSGSDNCVLKIETLEEPFKQGIQGPFTLSAHQKAIIIAGSKDYPGDYLWDNTWQCVTRAYVTLLNQGYTRDRIYLLSPEKDFDGDNDEIFNDVDGDATLADLEESIKWAENAGELLLYMTDHGNIGEFIMNPNETLIAEKLDTLLDDLQEIIPGRVIVIYDACHSGSFISLLTPPADKERIVITSSAADEPAYFEASGIFSFSYQFWAYAWQDGNLYRAFDKAREMMKEKQHAWLDADGDGDGWDDENNDVFKSEKERIKDILIGRGAKIAGEPPTIQAENKEQTLSSGTSPTIRVGKVSGNIAHVWAMILPPNYEVSPDLPITDLPKMELNKGSDAYYEGTYDDFDVNGTYKITVYAEDEEGMFSAPVQISVIQSGMPEKKGDIDGDGKISLKDAVSVLKLITGDPTDIPVSYFDADVNNDQCIGLAELIYILKQAAK
jgi:hypothetical protein